MLHWDGIDKRDNASGWDGMDKRVMLEFGTVYHLVPFNGSTLGWDG